LQASKFAIMINHSWAAKSTMNKDKQKHPSPALIVVGGFAGTGKTAVSRRLSAELSIPRLGSDTCAASATQPHKIHQRVMQAVAQFAAEEWPGLLVTMRNVVQSVWRASEAE